MQFRTPEELKRTQWNERCQSVAEGRLYTQDSFSPFPIHEYFKLGLLGKNIRMLEVNAGHALIEHMVADTMTELQIDLGNESLQQEWQEFAEEIEFDSLLEEAARDLYSTGFCVQQPIRTLINGQNGFKIANVDPASWYPVLPTFNWQDISEGRIISVFSEMQKDKEQWFAFIEHHKIGVVENSLLELERQDATGGKPIALSKLAKFAGVQESAKTDLEWLAVFQQNRQKQSRNYMGSSVLMPIWGILQEISEMQTQIRQERIKHFRSKMYVPRESLQRATDVADDAYSSPKNSKQTLRETNQAKFDANQEVFPIPSGSTTVPGFIQWDMQMIVNGSNEIDKLHSRAAAIVGAPRGVFNLDEKGDIHVDTEKRKDRRYVRKIIQGQRRLANLARYQIQTWCQWKNKEIPKSIGAKFTSPFDLTQEEAVALMREMNPDAKMVSEKEAIKNAWPSKKPKELEALQQEIDDERQSEVSSMSALDRIQNVTL